MDQQDPEDDASDATRSWLRHPFGRTFDLLSSEYGWTDEQILNLTLSRMRLAREMCFQRIRERQDRELDIAEQMTRVLVAHIRSAAGDKKASKVAARLTLFDRGKSMQVARVETIARKLGGSPGANEIDPDLVRRAYGPR